MNNAVRYQVMPPLSSEEYQELYESIKVEGIHEPIHIDEEGVIIDGHHRSRIAKELGIPCPVITHDDLDEAGKRSLAFTLNLKRRHLNREQRRALIAESLKTDPQLSNREHARRTGTSDKTVGAVRDDLESTAEIPQSDERVSGDGRVRPASQPKREPTATPADSNGQNDHDSQPSSNEEVPSTNIIGKDDLDELNAPAPAPENDKPRAEAITSQFTSAIVDLNRIMAKFGRIRNDRNFTRNKEKVAALHRHDLNRTISELQDLADQLN